MTPEQQARCEALLEEALDQPLSARISWLDTACGDDAVVRYEVERLLGLYAQVAEEFLEPPPFGWDAPVAQPGTYLGRYRILEQIGAGGMGVVVKGHDPEIDRPVAIKLLRSADAEARARFVAEARTLGRIRHDHVVQVFDVGAAGGVPYLVMELLEGETLAAAIQGGRTGPLTRRLTTARQIAAALAHVHGQGIVHRDIKPANVFVQRSGRSTLMDFGISRSEGQQTRSNALVGTLDYVAPEQLNGQAATIASDVYAFGVLLYELFTGRRPFTGTTAEVLYQVAHEPLPLEPLIAAGVAPSVRDGIARATAKQPVARPTLAALDSVLAEAETIAPIPSVRSTGRDQRTWAAAWSKWPRRRGPAMSAAALVALSLLGLGYFKRQALEAADSVAVMPFVNVPNDAGLDYLAEGLAESITNSLTRVESLRVIARSTAFSYKGREAQDLGKLGRDLNVRAIVTGTVSRSAGGKVRVQADLVDAASGTQLWGSRYDGVLDDLLRIHDDVVRNVTMQLRADVTGAGGQEAAHSPTSSPGAYELYLRGRHALSRATVPEIQRAIDLFQRALGVDPTYPQAYAGLADSYLGLSGMYLKPRDAMTKAKAAAARALELDPKLPEAHVSNGVVLAFYDFDWEGSAAEFRRAIELNPQDAGVRLWYAWNLVLTGHGEAGIAEATRARELDPLSAFVETGLAQMYYCSGQPSEAIQRLRVVVATDPGFFNGHYYLGVAYVQNGQYAEAIAELQEAERLDPQQPQPIAYLVYALARLGRTDAARGELARLNRMSNERYVSAYLKAVASAGLEQREETIRWLTTAHDDRDDMLAILRIERALSDVQTDQRIVALLQKIGLGPG